MKTQSTDLMYYGKNAEDIVREAFGVEPEGGIALLKGVVSRKKQLIPPLLAAEPEDMVRFIRSFGAEKCMFGCDFPFFRPGDVKELFLKLPLTDNEREQIAYMNAERLLKDWSKRRDFV